MAEDEVKVAAEFCKEMVRRMGLEVGVEAREEDGCLWINVTGPDRPMLLSNSASLLNSIEYLVAKAFRPRPDDNLPSIVLDSDEYRKHREAELVLLAEMASQKVRTERRSLTLQPMTPKERRIVHLALAEIEGVRSESQGDGDARSITIHPN